MTSAQEWAKFADALNALASRMAAELKKAAVMFAELENAAPLKPEQRHTMRAALEANARPVHRPLPARRIRRIQHR